MAEQLLPPPIVFFDVSEKYAANGSGTVKCTYQGHTIDSISRLAPFTTGLTIAGVEFENAGLQTLGEAKANSWTERCIVREAAMRVVGVVVENPENIGLDLIELMLDSDKTYRPVILGVAPHLKSKLKHEKFLQSAGITFGEAIQIERQEDFSYINSVQSGECSLRIGVGILNRLTEASGKRFAGYLQGYSS